MSDVPWALAVVMIPLMGALCCGLVSARRAVVMGGAWAVATVMAAVALIWKIVSEGPVVDRLGGWGAPLGIELWADGLAGAMVGMTAIVGIAVTVFSTTYFSEEKHSDDAEKSAHSNSGRPQFWSLWLVVWAGLNGVFVSSDLFNIYVCMEVAGLGSVALVALAGPLALRAAMRYLLVTLCGSLLFLLGVALLYSEWGMLDIRLLATTVEATPGSEVALIAMTIGLALKTALVPLHFWLPAAHANAPAPVSAVLSALVIKASFVVLLRLWAQVFGALTFPFLATLLTGLAVLALVWGSVQALRQSRLKMLVAYSTVAQVGFLFLAFAAGITAGSDGVAWKPVAYFIMVHACAKGAMFLAAGAMAVRVGDDQLDSIRGLGRQLWCPLLAFFMGGAALIGIPPSGGYLAKSLLSSAAAEGGQTWVAAVATIGGGLTGLYVAKVLMVALTFEDRGTEATSLQPVGWAMMGAAFILAAISLGVGPISEWSLQLLEVGLASQVPLGSGVGP